MQVLAGAILSLVVLLSGGANPAGFLDDVVAWSEGGGGGHSDIRWQPAPEEPWVWPTERPLQPIDPTRKRQAPVPQPHPVPPRDGGGQCNGDTPFGCW